MRCHGLYSAPPPHTGCVHGHVNFFVSLRGHGLPRLLRWQWVRTTSHHCMQRHCARCMCGVDMKGKGRWAVFLEGVLQLLIACSCARIRVLKSIQDGMGPFCDSEKATRVCLGEGTLGTVKSACHVRGTAKVCRFCRQWFVGLALFWERRRR